MEELIIETRITPRKTLPNIIHRERLMNMIHDNLDRNLLLICAPAGYGKTTLIEDFLNYHNITFAWLYASADINNPYTFLTYFIRALKRISDKFGELTLQIINTVKQEEKKFNGLENAIAEISGNFVNDFCRHFKSDTYLVIDDLHNIQGSEWLRLCFNKLIENMPENLHIVITSRTIPDFNLTRLSAKRNIFQIQPYDLNFTADEISGLLNNVYSLKYSDVNLKFLEEKLGGWITGIHLIIQAYGNSLPADMTGQNFPVGSVPENIFNFFANEIFTNLETNIREFLLNTAMLDIVEPGVCDSILGINNSGAIINELLNKNIFIQPVFKPGDSNPVGYSYQESFKQFLIAKLTELKSRKDVKLLLRKFTEYYLERGNTDNALNCSILAGDFDLSVTLIKDIFQKCFNEGRFESLWRWIEGLPADKLKTDPQLLYFKGQLSKFYAGDLEKALQYYNEAIALFEKQNKKEFIINCCISKADVLIFLGKNEEVIKDLTRLSEVDTSPENKAKLLYNLGHSHFMNSNYDSSLKFLNEALDICSENNFKDIQLDIFSVMGNIYLNRGEYVKGTFYYEKVIDKSVNLFKKFVSLCNLVLLCSRSGKYEKARNYISEAEELFHRFTTPIFETAFLLANFSLRFDAGDFEECITLIEKINKIAIKLNRKDYIHLSYELLAETYYYLNILNKASEYLDFAGNYLDRRNKIDVVQYSCSKANLKKKTGNIDADIERDFLEAYSVFSDEMFVENKVKIGYHLADYYYRAKMPDTALKYLHECLKTGAEKEYISFFERQLLDSRALFDFAIENKIEKQFIRNIIGSVSGRADLYWLSPACKTRLTGQIEDLHDINMECFGGLEFKIRGKAVPDDKWIRKKRKLVLAYLLLVPNAALTKDKIINMFYPDTPLDSTDNIFHQTISNIRSALRNQKAASETKAAGKNRNADKQNDLFPQLVIYEDKRLYLNPDYIYRVDALEFNSIYNSVMSKNTDAEKKIELSKKAIGLYKGELLAGHYEQWCEDLRQEYQNKFIKLSEHFIELLKSKSKYEDINLYSDRLLKVDRLNEIAYIHSIEASVHLGNINRAKDKFSQMLKTFNEELGEKPGESTLNRIKTILITS